jgi:hypothetical protein
MPVFYSEAIRSVKTGWMVVLPKKESGMPAFLTSFAIAVLIA